jgi:CBS domain containing-hemolysin-like protein
MDYSLLGFIIGSLLFSAFFSGVEIAYISSNKLHIELQGKSNLTGRILYWVTKSPSLFIGMTLVGNNIALVVYGIFMSILLEPAFIFILPEVINNPITVLILQTIISTLIVLATAEFLPKSIFLINPNTLLNVFSIPLFAIYLVLFPVVFIVVVLSRFVITRLFRLEYSEDKPAYGLTDLNHYIKSTLAVNNEESSKEVDTKMFHNALEFKTIKVRDCMIPRTEVIALDINDSKIDDLKKSFVDSGYSKVLVYRDSIDDVIGYCHSTALFTKPKDIEGILTPIMIVPETMLANELMITFITERKNLALVVDEFGGTSGIVTMEDIIEEIFGEIQDEHDAEDLIEKEIGTNEYLLSARHEIDYLNEKYGWSIPQGEYDTLGGFILSVTEDIPKKGQIITHNQFVITIKTMDDIRIDLVVFKVRERILSEE